MTRLPPRATRTYTLYPYAALFRSVLRCVVFETLVLGLAGAVLGTVLGVLLVRGLAPVAAQVPFLPSLPPDAVTVPGEAWVWPVALTVVAVAVALLVPAILASRVRPARALRGEIGRASCRERVCRYV